MMIKVMDQDEAREKIDDVTQFEQWLAALCATFLLPLPYLLFLEDGGASGDPAWRWSWWLGVRLLFVVGWLVLACEGKLHVDASGGVLLRVEQVGRRVLVVNGTDVVFFTATGLVPIAVLVFSSRQTLAAVSVVYLVFACLGGLFNVNRTVALSRWRKEAVGDDAVNVRVITSLAVIRQAGLYALYRSSWWIIRIESAGRRYRASIWAPASRQFQTVTRPNGGARYRSVEELVVAIERLLQRAPGA